MHVETAEMLQIITFHEKKQERKMGNLQHTPTLPHAPVPILKLPDKQLKREARLKRERCVVTDDDENVRKCFSKLTIDV